MNVPTGRQAKELPRVIARLRVDYELDIPDWSEWRWTTKWHDESRPGRGQDMQTVWIDSDHIVSIDLDVYGNGSDSVGNVDWFHVSAWEECECDPCRKSDVPETGEK